jgi:hypothetical protein
MGDHEWFIQQRWEEVYNKVQTEKLGEVRPPPSPPRFTSAG